METGNIHGQFDVTDVDAEIKQQKEKEEKEWADQIKKTKDKLANETAATHSPNKFPEGTMEHELSEADMLDVKDAEDDN